jgi:undecaprenyl-diphosphatase
MINEVILAIVQAATEFLPVSSSGHLALVSKLLSLPENLFFFTALHLASLFAVLIFTRKEIKHLFTFNSEAKKLWKYIIIATIPAALFGFFFKDIVEQSFNSYLLLGIAFIFTGLVIFATRFSHHFSRLDSKNSVFIGLMQALALFPGVSRSGMTISAGLFSGMTGENAAKFSFLLFIPVTLGAFLLELKGFYFSYSLLVAFFVCLVLSLVFLNLLYAVMKKHKFWMFAIYCWIIGLVSIWLWLM